MDDDERPDVLLGRAAAAKHGVVTLADIGAAGLSLRSMRYREHRGDWTTAGRGVWRLTAWPQSIEQEWMLACLSHGDEALLTWNSAAQRHDMPCQHPTTSIHLLCPDYDKARRAGVTTHRSRLIVPADRTMIGGIPTTSWPRTWIELSGRDDLSDKQLLWIYDEGVRRRVMTAEEARHTAARLRSANGRSMRRVRKLLGQRPSDHDPGLSQPESRIALGLRAAGFGQPKMNLLVVAGGVTWEIDVAYDDVLVGVDYNSHEYHSTPSAQEKDERKAKALGAAGWAFFTVAPGEDEATIVARVGPVILARRATVRRPPVAQDRPASCRHPGTR